MNVHATYPGLRPPPVSTHEAYEPNEKLLLILWRAYKLYILNRWLVQSTLHIQPYLYVKAPPEE